MSMSYFNIINDVLSVNVSCLIQHRPELVSLDVAPCWATCSRPSYWLCTKQTPPPHKLWNIYGKKSQHKLFSSDLDGTDAHDKAVNGRKADLYMGHKRRKMKMFSILRYSGSVHSCRVQLLLFDVWYSSSPFLLLIFLQGIKKGLMNMRQGVLTDIVCSLQRKVRAWGQVLLHTGGLRTDRGIWY